MKATLEAIERALSQRQSSDPLGNPVTTILEAPYGSHDELVRAFRCHAEQIGVRGQACAR